MGSKKLILTITTTHKPATDLGYLLVKHPDKCRIVDFPFGKASVFFSEATKEKCTAVVYLDIDPVRLTRHPGERNLFDYVNDRPYVTSSFMSVALMHLFRTAVGGKCKDKPGLEAQKIPLEINIPIMTCKGGEEVFRKLFEPLGWNVDCKEYDFKNYMWGKSKYVKSTIRGDFTVSDAISHLYIMIPVCDGDKHYYVGETEIEKLVRIGGTWLESHPMKRMIIDRYLDYRKSLVSEAEDKLSSDEEILEKYKEKEEKEHKKSLYDARLDYVIKSLKERNVESIIELGCGEGKVLRAISSHPSLSSKKIAGLDVSLRSLSHAKHRLRKTENISLFHGAATYKDGKIKDFDAVLLVEVIEHQEKSALPRLEDVVFGFARPRIVIVTTPNKDYNKNFGLSDEKLRHRDHRFEFSIEEFDNWCEKIKDKFKYNYEKTTISQNEEEAIGPSFGVVFTRIEHSNVRCPESLINIHDVLDKRMVSTELDGDVSWRNIQASVALEQIARFSVDPNWLIYLPPTMSPCETAPEDSEFLERPREAFDYYRNHGVSKVVCQIKHMGSRMISIVCKDSETAKKKFGSDDKLGVCYSRLGRPFFVDQNIESQIIDELRTQMTNTGMWKSLDTNWVVFDGELMPWSAKAKDLIIKQYATVGLSGQTSLENLKSEIEKFSKRNIDVKELPTLDKLDERLFFLKKYDEMYNRYCWKLNGIKGLKYAIFHVMASEGKVHTDKTNLWHIRNGNALALESNIVFPTDCYLINDLNSEKETSFAIAWWNDMTTRGDEGMVVKPMNFVEKRENRLIQHSLKCRGKDYLRIIYGPEYTDKANIDRLRQRSVFHKRKKASQEFALGIEALNRFVKGEPLSKIHECVFGIVALECNEMDDPRL